VIADVANSLLVRCRQGRRRYLVMCLAVAAVRCRFVAVNFCRRQLGFKREIGGQHEHERRGYAEPNNRVEDWKNPAERLMIRGGLRAEIPDPVACDQPCENRNIPADARNFQRAAIRRAH